MIKRLLSSEPLGWAVIFLLLASARLFETGLSLDPAIYSTIARNLATDGDLWNLHAGKYFFPQFFEHPFLAFWIQSLVFKILGASDWSSRILGVIAGAMSMFHLFRWAARLVSPYFARMTCALTALSIPFVGRMGTFYLEILLVYGILACIDFFDRSERNNSAIDATLAGLFLGLCFLTKGIATFPLVALIAIYSLYQKRMSFYRDRCLWTTLTLGVAIFIVFLAMQHRMAAYSFAERYLATGFFGKAVRPGISPLLPLWFFWQFIKLHPVHAILAALFAYYARKKTAPQGRTVLTLAGSGLLLFGVANGLLGKSHQHYFYPLFPFANLLAAGALVVILPERYETKSWLRGFFIFALAYQVLWNWIPASHRRKPPTDLLEIQPRISTLRAQNITEIAGLGISDPQWSYPAMSLWYWGVDTQILAEGQPIREPAAVLDHRSDLRMRLEQNLNQAGYERCYSGETFSLWVRDPAVLEDCLHSSMKPSALR